MALPLSLLCSSAFGAALAEGNKPATYPVLSFLLGRLPALKKRAYVARFLMPVEVPPALQHAEGVADALTQYAGLQAEFKEAHMAFERAAGAWREVECTVALSARDLHGETSIPLLLFSKRGSNTATLLLIPLLLLCVSVVITTQ